MPLSSRVVGKAGPFEPALVDARWLMAYAAGLGEAAPWYFDTLRPGGIAAHPLFPVCFEWPVLLKAREGLGAGLTAAESMRGVHASYDLHWHRPLRAGEKVLTRATVAAVESRPSGALQLVRFETVSAKEEPLCTSWYGSLFRGVAVEGEGVRMDGIPEAAPKSVANKKPLEEAAVSLSAGAAHVYTECSRIWNPIHTDPQFAKAAGLPGIILHGTAALALAASRILGFAGNPDPRRVRRVAGRFGAMVPLPSAIRVQLLERKKEGEDEAFSFQVFNTENAPAVKDGFVLVGPGS